MWVFLKQLLPTRYSLGVSIEGRQLEAVKLTAPDGKLKRPLLRPMVRVMGNIHGDGSVSREMVIALVKYLTYNYGRVDRVTTLLDTTEVHLVPSLNPDGFERVTRGNSRGVDLNSNFPTWNEVSLDRSTLLRNREEEVAAVINWTLDNPFVLSLNLKDGDLGVTFPWTANFTRVWERSTMFRRYPGADEAERMGQSPDEESFQALSKVFTSAHPLMKSSQADCSTFRQEVEVEEEERGRREIFSGSLQDFTYLFSNCLEIAAHLGCVKKPLASSLQVSSLCCIVDMNMNLNFIYGHSNQPHSCQPCSG